MSIIGDNKKQVIEICKMGQGGACCKYLVVGSKGFECMKTDPLTKKVVDVNWATTAHVSQGDNCEGYGKEMQQKG